jgi:hypothetical protein
MRLQELMVSDNEYIKKRVTPGNFVYPDHFEVYSPKELAKYLPVDNFT